MVGDRVPCQVGQEKRTPDLELVRRRRRCQDGDFVQWEARCEEQSLGVQQSVKEETLATGQKTVNCGGHGH